MQKNQESVSIKTVSRKTLTDIENINTELVKVNSSLDNVMTGTSYTSADAERKNLSF